VEFFAMNTEKLTIASPQLSAFNYCACFIDILGQRHALRDQGILPIITTAEERLRFIKEVLANTIRPITRLQTQANQFVDGFIKPVNSPTRQTLPPELREEWDKIQGHELHLQYWSDGLVAFACLGNKEVPFQINSAFALLGMAGSLCFSNLSYQFRNPLRGGIEIAWGTELRPGELYGPAIARSYELESEVAQYPRIAVGTRMIEFLKTVAALEPKDNYSLYSSMIAKLCLQMLIRDIDGQWMIHYLGEAFQETVSRQNHIDMYNEALQFISEEYARFRTAGDAKLAMRYHQLLSYFQNHPPKDHTHAADYTV
jgi:hypothetical protein